MIGFLRGIIVAKQPPQVLLEVNGVGYEIEAPMSTFYDLPERGVETTLRTHLVVREDAHVLYGFAREAERRLFRSLIRVNGVGPRLALTILSGASVDEFAHYVQSGDAIALTRLPGVGKKTAERLVVEMRDRLDGTLQAPDVSVVASAPADEAHSALVALGYKSQEASRMLNHIEQANLTSEELIRQALRATI